ncbi:CC0125/CC1285 family lipoprotein [Shewanella frigidimarina]|uniref:CC0125/CC1285 family lipoprotein n=1 Tax=Shewanella frigidimarina TaxID=56812 RepID=UPI003D79AF80
MKSIINLCLCAGIALVLTACATPYDTQKHFWSFGEGFETVQIAPNSWQISFVGNTNTGRGLARKYVMRKSAELSQQAGFTYFAFTNEHLDRDSVGQFGVGFEGGHDTLWGSSSTTQETSVLVEVTGLHAKEEHQGSRVYDVNFILSNVDVEG